MEVVERSGRTDINAEAGRSGGADGRARRFKAASRRRKGDADAAGAADDVGRGKKDVGRGEKDVAGGAALSGADAEAPSAGSGLVGGSGGGPAAALAGRGAGRAGDPSEDELVSYFQAAMLLRSAAPTGQARASANGTGAGAAASDEEEEGEGEEEGEEMRFVGPGAEDEDIEGAGEGDEDGTWDPHEGFKGLSEFARLWSALSEWFSGDGARGYLESATGPGDGTDGGGGGGETSGAQDMVGSIVFAMAGSEAESEAGAALLRQKVEEVALGGARREGGSATATRNPAGSVATFTEQLRRHLPKACRLRRVSGGLVGVERELVGLILALDLARGPLISLRAKSWYAVTLLLLEALCASPRCAHLNLLPRAGTPDDALAHAASVEATGFSPHEYVALVEAIDLPSLTG